MRSSDLKWANYWCQDVLRCAKMLMTGFCKFCTFTRFAADLSWSLGVWSATGVIGLDRGVLRSTTFAELNQHGWDVAIWNPTYVWDQQKAEKCVTLCDWFILLGRTCSILWSSQSWTKELSRDANWRHCKIGLLGNAGCTWFKSFVPYLVWPCIAQYGMINSQNDNEIILWDSLWLWRLKRQNSSYIALICASTDPWHFFRLLCILGFLLPSTW